MALYETHKPVIVTEFMSSASGRTHVEACDNLWGERIADVQRVLNRNVGYEVQETISMSHSIVQGNDGMWYGSYCACIRLVRVR
jgi:hypothetical protein